jgi:hypothetical protein
MWRTSLVLIWILVYCSVGVLDADMVPASRIQATYWGIKSVPQGTEQLGMLQAYGLNAALVKDGAYRVQLDLWREWGNIAEKHQIRLFPVLNFAGTEELNQLQGTYMTYVDRTGKVFSVTPCPLDVTYWTNAIGQRFEQLAQLSQSTAIAGLLFDAEMYGSDIAIYNDCCFCDRCWETFAKTNHLKVFNLVKEQRFAYLTQQNLFQRYTTFQEQQLQAILSHIETRIHQINPSLALGFLPYLDNWFYAGLLKGLGTKNKPVMVFSETSYVRGYTPYVTDEQRRIAEKATSQYIPGLWLGRFWPQDLPSQLYALATHTDGYWLFTADSLWAGGPSTGAYTLHGSSAEYWAAIQTTNEALTKFSKDPNAFNRGLPPIYPSSFYDPVQHRLTTPPSLKQIMDILFLPQAMMPLPAQPDTRITYRGKTLFHGFTQGPALTIRITHIPLAQYTDPTQYKLFDADGFVIQEGSLGKQNPSTQISLPQNVSGIVSLLTDSGANATQVSFSGLVYLIEASSTFPLATINTSYNYPIYIKPGNQRLKLRAYCSGRETALITVQSPDRTVSQETRILDSTEITIPLPFTPGSAATQTQAPIQPNPNLSLQFQSGQVIVLPTSPTQTENKGQRNQGFWAIKVNPVIFEPFEDVQFYLYDEEFPYLLMHPN